MKYRITEVNDKFNVESRWDQMDMWRARNAHVPTTFNPGDWNILSTFENLWEAESYFNEIIENTHVKIIREIEV